ncbi:MAG: hypothetical protein H6815_03160 [Phycisphaeraceae bacterium]|nr:hypothetical protein [Phycisphaerales bacterium]MCB9859427.1 hypothetical protein [Phycisphaeraceae bacterium]
MRASQRCCCHRATNTSSGFVIGELVATLVVLLVVVAVLIPALLNMRRNARLAGDMGKLHAINGWMLSYAADSNDDFATIWWQGGVTYAASLPQLMLASDDLQAGANQAAEIIRTVGDRPDFQRVTGWLAQARYAHLVLVQYAGLPLPSTDFVSTGDVHRMNWTKDPENKFENNFWIPYQPAYSGNSSRRWPYSTSFEYNPAIWDNSDVGSRASNSSSSVTSYSVASGADLRPHARTEARYPSQKAVVYDQNAWHFDRSGHFFWFDEARLPILFADGHVSVRVIANSNMSMNPNFPLSTISHTSSVYTPRTYDPPTPNGSPSWALSDHIRWTRAGLKGRDFGGPEVVETP